MTAAASAEPAPPPSRPAVRLGAPIDGRFAHVLTCDAPGGGLSLRVWAVGKGLLGVCGMAVQASAVFYLPESGPPRLAPEVFKDISLGGTREGPSYGISRVRGADLDHLDADIYEVMSRGGFSYAFQKTGKAWKKTGTSQFEGAEGGCFGSCAIIGGHPLTEVRAEGEPSRFGYVDGHRGWLPARAKVASCGEEVSAFTLLVRRGKELWGLGSACGKGAVQRWTVGGQDTSAEPLDLPVREGGFARSIDLGDRELAVLGSGQDLALFDGRRWQPLLTLDEPQDFEVRRTPQRIWVQGRSRLFHLEGSKLEEVPLPQSGYAWARFSPSGEVRLWNEGGLYSLDEAYVWHPVPLPKGTEIVEMEHLGGRWTFHANHGSDGAQDLFVEGGTGPALSIKDPGAAVSPVAFVKPLRPGCGEPFALLYKLSKAAPKDYDYPATKTALATHPRLRAGRFSEVSAFGDRYLVVRYPEPRAVERLTEVAAVVTREVKGAKPQLLCADAVPGGLPTTREVEMK